MDIQSGYYEAGIGSVLAAVRLSVHGQVPVQGAAWRDMFREGTPPHGKSSAGVAGWFDPVKEERKKERQDRRKGKRAGKEIPAVSREKTGERASTATGGNEGPQKKTAERKKQ